MPTPLSSAHAGRRHHSRPRPSTVPGRRTTARSIARARGRALAPLVVAPLLVVLALVEMGGAALAAPAPTIATDARWHEARFVAEINDLRASLGLPTLSPDPAMHEAAEAWTRVMIADGELKHGSSLGDGLEPGWNLMGENVGRGRSVDSLLRSFLASGDHRENLLNPDWTHLGVSVALGPDGRLWTTHRFADRS